MNELSRTVDLDVALQERDDEKGASGDLGNRLLKHRVIVIAKPIDRRVMERTAAAAMLLDSENSSAPITVIVNSPGGDADSGFAIYDILRFVKSPVRTLCCGLAASAAVPIFLSSERGRRFCTPNSRFLIHQPSMQMTGQASDMEITANEIVKIRDRYNEIIAAETGKPSKQILKDANRDFWLSATEAKEYGLVDKVVIKRSEIE
ncbi:MAG: ATP-dependent Clp protease proteolytic subunit [Planctomycetota bacterium]